jgi:FtsH-binding integral membrane protein
MSKIKVLKALLITIAIAFITLQVLELEFYGAALKVLLFSGLTLLYHIEVKEKSWFFRLFLYLFTMGVAIDFIAWLLVFSDKFVFESLFYYSVNMLFITSYAVIIAKMLSALNLKSVIKKLPIHILVLLILDVFSVIIVTETTEKVLNSAEYMLEFIYNSVVMILLSVALLNYIYRDDIKSMNMLLASILIVFSEIIQMAYFYIEDDNTFNIMCSVLLVGAFVFFYIQSTLKHGRPIMETFSENLKI